MDSTPGPGLGPRAAITESCELWHLRVTAAETTRCSPRNVEPVLRQGRTPGRHSRRTPGRQSRRTPGRQEQEDPRETEQEDPRRTRAPALRLAEPAHSDEEPVRPKINEYLKILLVPLFVQIYKTWSASQAENCSNWTCRSHRGCEHSAL